MTARLGLRTRLTVFVTLAFAAAISVISIVVVDLIEDDLVDDTRASAETVLTTYLESIYGGIATVGVIDDTESTRFFYRDADDNEITEQQYFETLAAGFDREFAALVDSGELIGGEFVTSGVIGVPADDPRIGAIEIHPDTGELLDAAGSVIPLVQGPQPEGDPHRVDLGDDVVGVAQTLSFNDGTTLDVGVSSPLQPVTDSIDAIRQLLWIAVPSLIAAIAAITWLAATRALRPVHAISSRARAITAANIDDRLPVPEAGDEIRELATTVNDMLARLERSQRQQHQLVSDASHELRNPVAASRAQLEVATNNPDTTDWPATATTVLAEQEHLSRLIDDLLGLSRFDEAGPHATDDVDLDDLIATEVGRPHPTPIRTSIPAPVRVTGDQALLTRAIRNLIDNATRHAAGDVLITLHSHSGTAVVSIDDDGPGIPVDQRQRVFDRFARIDEARDRNGGGAGLGLALAREVARAHHGDITADESPLGGARLTLTIPQQQSDGTGATPEA